MTNRTILLVEDDEFLRELYTDLLEGEHYSVQVAIDGAEAYSLLSSTVYDLILLDVNIPVMSGIEVVQKYYLKNESKKPLRLVFLTNMEDVSITTAAKTFHCDYLIKSSLSPDGFIRAVKRQLENNRV